MCKPRQANGFHITRVYVEHVDDGENHCFPFPTTVLGTVYIAHSSFRGLEQELRAVLHTRGGPDPDAMIFWAGRRIVHEGSYPELFPAADEWKVAAKVPACLDCSLFGPSRWHENKNNEFDH